MAKSKNTNEPETTSEQITIGDKTFKIAEHPELLKLVQDTTQQASKVEKDKLYSTIEQQKVSLGDLQTENNRLVKIVETPPVTSQTNGQPTPQNVIPQVNPQQVIPQPNQGTPQTTASDVKEELKQVNKETPMTQESVNDMVAKAFSSQLPAAMKPFLDPLEKQTEAIQQSQVDAYRATRLKELGDTVIPELVRGTSKDEIETSIVEALEVSKKYNVAPPTQDPPAKTTPPATEQTPPVTNTPAVPAPLQTHPIPGETELDIKGMTDAEFAKNRDKLQARIKTEAKTYASSPSL